jgi:hypothetical protein
MSISLSQILCWYQDISENFSHYIFNHNLPKEIHNDHSDTIENTLFYKGKILVHYCQIHVRLDELQKWIIDDLNDMGKFLT